MLYTKIFLGLIMALFIAFGVNDQSINAADSNCKVHDFDDSLKDSEEEKLNKKVAKAADKIDANVAVVITSDKAGRPSEMYAKEVYTDLFGANSDGVLLLIDNDTEYDYIFASGKIRSKYDRYADSFMDDISPCVKKGDYVSAVEEFADNIDLSAYKKSGTMKRIAKGALIGVVVSLVVCLLIAKSYKSVKKYEAKNYEVKGDTRFSRKDDRFLREYTTKTKIESNNDGSGNGGGRQR